MSEQLTSFEAKLLSRGEPRDRTIPQLRLPYHLVEPTVVAVDLIIVIVISLLVGIGYSWFFLDVIPEDNDADISCNWCASIYQRVCGPSCTRRLPGEQSRSIFTRKRAISCSSGPAFSSCYSQSLFR